MSELLLSNLKVIKMALVIGLLDCAMSNLESPTPFGVMLAKGQIKQYIDLKRSGAEDGDDVDEALEKYPDCHLKVETCVWY